MTFEFMKMHAHGDDFVLVDGLDQTPEINAQVVQALGSRHAGIGFNQLAVIFPDNEAAGRLEFWNPDGSKLGACGSATRGAAQYLMQRLSTRSVVLRTERGLLECTQEKAGAVRVDMGKPLLAWDEIPLAVQKDTLHLPLPGDPVACSMGNPHCTFFVDDIDAVDIATVGPTIERHALFPQRTNVHFVQIYDRHHIRLRIWERYGSIPAGSGSCSCGAVVAGIRRGILSNSVKVDCDGGSVEVYWNGEEGVQLIGTVELVFVGRTNGLAFENRERPCAG